MTARQERGNGSEVQQVVLNKPVHYTFEAEEQAALLSSGISNYKIHVRAKSNGQIFTSKLYDVKKKRCNSFVRFVSPSASGYGQIACFLAYDSNVLCIIRVYTVQHLELFYHKGSLHQIKHLLPVQETKVIETIPLKYVQQKVIKAGSYLCLRPNVFEVNL